MITNKSGNTICRAEDRKRLILRIFTGHFPAVNNKDNIDKGYEERTHRRLHLNIRGKNLSYGNTNDGEVSLDMH